jgi:hypothetical protein
VEKYKRFLYSTVIWLPIYAAFISILDYNERPLMSGILEGLFGVVFVLMLVISFKVYQRMGRLKKR